MTKKGRDNANRPLIDMKKRSPFSVICRQDLRISMTLVENWWTPPLRLLFLNYQLVKTGDMFSWPTNISFDGNYERFAIFSFPLLEFLHHSNLLKIKLNDLLITFDHHFTRRVREWDNMIIKGDCIRENGIKYNILSNPINRDMYY